jgi:hypothetical protein
VNTDQVIVFSDNDKNGTYDKTIKLWNTISKWLSDRFSIKSENVNRIRMDENMEIEHLIGMFFVPPLKTSNQIDKALNVKDHKTESIKTYEKLIKEEKIENLKTNLKKYCNNEVCNWYELINSKKLKNNK